MRPAYVDAPTLNAVYVSESLAERPYQREGLNFSGSSKYLGLYSMKRSETLVVFISMSRVNLRTPTMSTRTYRNDAYKTMIAPRCVIPYRQSFRNGHRCSPVLPRWIWDVENGVFACLANHHMSSSCTFIQQDEDVYGYSVPRTEHPQCLVEYG